MKESRVALVSIVIAFCVITLVQAQSVIYQDDFNRVDLGPDWDTCGSVSIVSDSLQLSHAANSGPLDCVHRSIATLVAPGTNLRNARVQFDLDNGGPTRANNIFSMTLGPFEVTMTQDTSDAPRGGSPHRKAQRPRRTAGTR